MLCSLSRLEDQQLQEIQSLEQELGKNLLSYTCRDLTAAELTEAELEKIRDLEGKLGLSLVAVK